jgi:Flp pilus assembly protein TadD
MTVEARKAYEDAIQNGPSKCPLDVYLRVGNLYLDDEALDCAVDVFTQACISLPCASVWLGLGIALLRTGRFADADLALAEASVLDENNGLIWGYLALVHVLVQNHAEAALVWQPTQRMQQRVKIHGNARVTF